MTQGPILAEGLGRLHFAGEHTCLKFVGFMEGAQFRRDRRAAPGRPRRRAELTRALFLPFGPSVVPCFALYALGPSSIVCLLSGSNGSGGPRQCRLATGQESMLARD